MVYRFLNCNSFILPQLPLVSTDREIDKSKIDNDGLTHCCTKLSLIQQSLLLSPCLSLSPLLAGRRPLSPEDKGGKKLDRKAPRTLLQPPAANMKISWTNHRHLCDRGKGKHRINAETSSPQLSSMKEESSEHWGYCNTCGRAGRHPLCGGCHVASHCSIHCQKSDWKGISRNHDITDFGHRHYCRLLKQEVDTTTDNIIKDLIVDLMNREIEWLTSLTEDEKRIVVGNVEGNIAYRFRWNERNHLLRSFRYYNYLTFGSIALVLLRVNPCLHLTYMNDTSGYSHMLSSKVLLPWYKQHYEALRREGFCISWKQSVLHQNLVGPLIRDMRSPMLSVINDCYVASDVLWSNSPRTAGGTDYQSRFDLLQARDDDIDKKFRTSFLHYFLGRTNDRLMDPCGRFLILDKGVCLISYMLIMANDSASQISSHSNSCSQDYQKILTEQQLNESDYQKQQPLSSRSEIQSSPPVRRLSKQRREQGRTHTTTISVPCMRKSARRYQAVELGLHFCICRKVLKQKAGLDIFLDMFGANTMDNVSKWSDMDIISTWIAAAECNITRLLCWLNEDNETKVISTELFEPSRLKSLKKQIVELSDSEEVLKKVASKMRKIAANTYFGHAAECIDLPY